MTSWFLEDVEFWGEKNDRGEVCILNTDKQDCGGKKTIGADDKTF